MHRRMAHQRRQPKQAWRVQQTNTGTDDEQQRRLAVAQGDRRPSSSHQQQGAREGNAVATKRKGLATPNEEDESEAQDDHRHALGDTFDDSDDEHDDPNDHGNVPGTDVESEPRLKKKRMFGKPKGSWQLQKMAIVDFLQAKLDDGGDRELMLALGPETTCDWCLFHVDIQDDGTVVNKCAGAMLEKAKQINGASMHSRKADWACTHCRHTLKKGCSFKQYPKEMPIPQATPLGSDRLKEFEEWIITKAKKKATKKRSKQSELLRESEHEDEVDDVFKILEEARLQFVSGQGHLAKARENNLAGWTLLGNVEAILKKKLHREQDGANG